MQLGTALNLPNPRINFGGTGRAPGKGNTAIFSFETGVLDSRINFSRTTNATVTNSAGQITYAPMNLLLASEQFDNAAWVKSNVTVTSNTTTAQNGTITADTITSAAANGFIYQTFSAIAGTTYTFSCYVKSVSTATTLQIALLNASGASGIASVEFTTTDEWIRVSVTGTSATTQTAWVAFGTGGTFNTGETFYAWGAQLEIGSTATTYNPTTVKNLLGYSELFDNAAWTKSNSFVQTNLLTYSEAFDNAAWTKDTSAITSNSIIAPNCYQTADKLTTTTASAQHSLLTANISVTSGVTYTHTYYAKKGEINFFFIGWSTPFFGAFNPAYFNLETGEITTGAGTTATITDVGNGWWRCSATRTATATGAVQLRVGLTDSNSSTTSTGANTTDGIYIWGAQLVQGSVAGDYRRTDAAALPVYYPNHNGVVCAEKLVENTANNFHYIISPLSSVVVGTTYTESIYLKYAGKQYVLVRFWATGATQYYIVKVDLLTGTVVGSPSISGTTNNSYSITPVGDGWYRISLTCAFTSGATGADLRVFFEDNSGNASYTGDGTSGIYIFGAQLSDSASLDPYVLNAAAAPTAAAYYGPRFDYDPVTLAPKGLLIEEQRTNLLTYSDDFSNAAWTKQNSSITSNTVLAPDGTNTADTLTANGILTTHWVYQTNAASATGKTISIYAKAGTNNFIQILFGGDINPWANFNLATGEVGSTGTTVTASMKDSGNGWYRIIVSTTSTTASNVYFSIIENATSGRADVNSLTTTVHLWGAQSEIGAFATSYIPTAASQVTRAADVATIQGSNLISWLNINEGTISSSLISNNLNANARFLYMTSDLTTSNSRLFDIYLGSSTRIDAVSVTNASVVVNQTITPSPSLTANSTIKVAYGYAQNNTNFAANNTVATTDTVCILPYGNFTFYLGALGLTSTSNFLNGTIKSISYYPQRLSNDVLKGLTA